MDWIQIFGLGVALAGAVATATFAILKIQYGNVVDRLSGHEQTLLERLADQGLRIRSLEAANSELVAANEKIRGERGAVGVNPHVEALKAHLGDPNFDLWTYGRGGLQHDAQESAIPIVSVINFKGGVGKTTLTSCLASYLSSKHSSRVLLIDIDYQGSLTNLCRRAWVSKQGRFPIAGFSKVIPGDWLYSSVEPSKFVSESFRLDAVLPQSTLLETDYKFLSIENRAYLRWAIDPEMPDARLRLRELLHSSYVSSNFDIVLIDCPPRLSLGAINAMLASSHYVVPSIFDRMSAEPIELLLTQMAALFGKDGGPKFVGVVGTQTELANNWRGEELRIKTDIDRVIKDAEAGSSVFSNSLPNRVAFLRTAGQKFAYQAESEVRAWVDPIGQEFVRRVGGLRKSVTFDIAAAE